MKGEEGLNTHKTIEWLMKKKVYALFVTIYLLILAGLVFYLNFNFISVMFGVLIAFILVFFERQIRKVF